MSHDPVERLLSYYPTLKDAQARNLRRIANHGRLAGTGKFVVLPVDQGFEHGPGPSFEPVPEGYDPVYHAKLASESGCNAYSAPLGFIEAAHDEIRRRDLPTILKVNSHDKMMPDGDDPKLAITAWVDDAVRLGCEGVGFAIYPGSKHAGEMYEQVRELVRDCRSAGIVVVLWAYSRGSGLGSTEAETALDVVCYAVHIAAQLGAHIIKAKPPTSHLAFPESAETYANVPTDTLADRIRLVMRSAFDGKRIVINSGGVTRSRQDVIDEVTGLAQGGSHGSIVGRNAFRRPWDEAVSLLHDIQDTFGDTNATT